MWMASRSEKWNQYGKLLCLNSRSASCEGPFAVVEGKSLGETLLTESAIVKWDGPVFGALPGCVTRCFTLTSWFLMPWPANVMIYVTRCRHFISFFFLFRASKESWDSTIATKDSSGASFKKREKKVAFGGCIWGAFRLGQPSRGVVTWLAFKCGLRILSNGQ